MHVIVKQKRARSYGTYCKTNQTWEKSETGVMFLSRLSISAQETDGPWSVKIHKKIKVQDSRRYVYFNCFDRLMFYMWTGVFRGPLPRSRLSDSAYSRQVAFPYNNESGFTQTANEWFFSLSFNRLQGTSSKVVFTRRRRPQNKQTTTTTTNKYRQEW